MARLILVADDSPTVQRKAQGILQGEGFEVETVSNGVAAIKKLPQLHPSLVLADVSMPGKDGYEVCEYVRSSEDLCHVPVLLVISDLEPYDELRGAQVGANGIIKKPFTPEQLIGMVAKFVGFGEAPASESAPSGTHGASSISPEPPPEPALHGLAQFYPAPTPAAPANEGAPGDSLTPSLVAPRPFPELAVEQKLKPTAEPSLGQQPEPASPIPTPAPEHLAEAAPEPLLAGHELVAESAPEPLPEPGLGIREPIPEPLPQAAPEPLPAGHELVPEIATVPLPEPTLTIPEPTPEPLPQAASEPLPAGHELVPEITPEPLPEPTLAIPEPAPEPLAEVAPELGFIAVGPEPLLAEQPTEPTPSLPPSPELVAPEADRTTEFRLPAEIAERMLTDEMGQAPAASELHPLGGEKYPRPKAATSLDSYSLAEAAEGQVYVAPPETEPAPEAEVAPPGRALTSPPSALDWEWVYAVVHKVVLKMAPPLLPPELVEDLARMLTAEITAELNAAPPRA